MRYRFCWMGCLLFGMVIGLLPALPAAGAVYQFGDVSVGGGTVSARMDISVDGGVLTAHINNTSQVVLDDGFTNWGADDSHAPGIVSFGFDIGDDTGTLLDWQLTGFGADGLEYTVGSKGDHKKHWVKTNKKVAGVDRDVLFKTKKGLTGALYHPDAAYSVALGSTTSYFTTAVLEMQFAGELMEPASGYAPFIWMKNIGVDGTHKTRLYGSLLTDSSLTAPIIPEPVTLFLGAMGLITVGFRMCGRGACL